MLDTTELTAAERIAACMICTISPALRVCPVCHFNIGLEWKALTDEIVLCPPDTYRIADDPDRLGEAVALAYMEFPEPDWREKRRQEWQEFLARMNAPEVVESRNGMKLTPHGWRNQG